MNKCKGFCDIYKEQVSQSNRDVYRLSTGLVRCQSCGVNIPKEAVTIKNRCACCNTKIRLKSRHGNLKDQMVETVARI